jgi:hypothetical protein
MWDFEANATEKFASLRLENVCHACSSYQEYDLRKLVLAMYFIARYWGPTSSL